MSNSKYLQLIIFFTCSVNLISQPLEANKFLIGTWVNPNITGNNEVGDIRAFRLASNAYINLLTYPYYYDTFLWNQVGITWALNIANSTNLDYAIFDSRHWIQSIWYEATPTETFDPQIAQQVTDYYTSLEQNLRNALFGYYIKDEPSPSLLIHRIYR
ncbi:MAG TPA: hypothetical protein PKA80_01045 [Ignavibacteriaceae bacterium]|nr:hypothetical protein [Ignavibacteriaceae bacterium]